MDQRCKGDENGQVMDTQNPPRSHFGNPFLIMNPPEKSFLEPFSDREGKLRSPEKVSEKGFSGFRKTTPMLLSPKPRDTPPLVFIPRTPQVVLGPLYHDGGGSPGGAFGGGGGSRYQLPGCTTWDTLLPAYEHSLERHTMFGCAPHGKSWKHCCGILACFPINMTRISTVPSFG